VNNVELNFNALVAASTALLGAEKTNMLSELYTLLDNAEKIGEASGAAQFSEKSYQDGYDECHNDVGDHGDFRYHEGFNDGIEHAHEDNNVYDKAYDDGFAAGVEFVDTDYHAGFTDGQNDVLFANEQELREEAYADGYEQARADLGECPIVDQDWDCDEEGYLRRVVHAMVD
jgi:hypothetical protein